MMVAGADIDKGVTIFTTVYDTTVTALTQAPNDPVLQHRAVLALARGGL